MRRRDFLVSAVAALAAGQLPPMMLPVPSESPRMVTVIIDNSMFPSAEEIAEFMEEMDKMRSAEIKEVTLSSLV